MNASAPIATRLRDSFWHLLCHRSELPQLGDYLKLDWLGQEVVVFNDHGELVVFDNLCPHRGTRFFTERQGNGAISCPYHGWSYQSGALHIPCRERYAESDLQHVRLNTMQTDWCADFLFAAITPRLSLDQQLGDSFNLLGSLSFNIDGRADFNAYTFECDWRIALENALEPLHVPFIHQDSLGQLDLGDGENQFTDWSSVWQAPLGNKQMAKKLQGIKRLFLLDEPYQGYQSIYLFPFTMLSSTFGYSYSLQHFFPSAEAHRTHFSSRLLSGVAKNAAAAHALSEFFRSSAAMNRQVFAEDHLICQRVYRSAADQQAFQILSDDEVKISHFRLCLVKAAQEQQTAGELA